MISGPAAMWLRREREGLNLRVRMARHQGHHVDSQLLSAWLTELLPALCARGASDELLQTTFDLVVLLVGSGRLAMPGSLIGDAQMNLLQCLPAMAQTLSKRPALLTAWSNAIGNLADGGLAFVRELPRLAACCPVEQLHDAGVVLAWRVGEARLRERALALTKNLPADALAVALAVATAHVPSAVKELRANAWRQPGTPRQLGTVLQRLGDFHGLGGPFAALPEILVSSQNHRLHIRCADVVHDVAVDGYGWRSHPHERVSTAVSRPVLSTTFTAHLHATSWIVLPSEKKPQVLICAKRSSFRLNIIDLEPT